MAKQPTEQPKRRPYRPPVVDKLSRKLVTPEGVDLRLNLASAGERAGAFMIDFSIQMVTMIAFTIIYFYSGADDQFSGEVTAIIFFLLFFFLRNFYFIAFEIGSKSSTPGKRLMGLRVTSRNGDRLTADAVFARNAMREVEVYLPLSYSFMGEGVDGLISLFAFLWGLIFMLMPLFNKDKLRAGDMIAGTWVIKAPKPKLEKDLARTGEAQISKGLDFSDEELNAYGVYELHVLEDVLRLNKRENIIEVAKQIRKKLDRKRDNGFTERQFLEAYYTALRNRLEHKLAYGVRRKDKYDNGDVQH